jgi:hypothetical protein
MFSTSEIFFGFYRILLALAFGLGPIVKVCATEATWSLVVKIFVHVAVAPFALGASYLTLVLLLAVALDWRHTRKNALRQVYLRKASNWVSNHQKLIRRRKTDDHCWLPLVNWSSVSEEAAFVVASSIGPLITRPQLNELFYLFGESPFITCYGVVNGNHAALGAGVPISSPEWKYLGVTNGGIIDTAVSINAGSLGLAEAQMMFKREMKETYKLMVGLTDMQKLTISSMVDFPVTFLGGRAITNDHPVLASLRLLVRQVHQNQTNISQTFVPTLVVGSTDREVNLYGDTHVDHYFHGQENKDYSRLMLPMLNRLARTLKQRSHANRAGSAAPSKPVVMAYHRAIDLIDALRSVKALPEGIHVAHDTIEQKYERLVFEDIYDLNANDYRQWFLRTGANSGVGYGIYPEELIFPQAAPNNEYVYSYDSITGKASMVFKGYSNGYSHDHAKWAVFLKNPVLSFPEFKLVFEITSRVGPYMTYTITKVPATSVDPVVRRLEITKDRHYVQLLDVATSVNRFGYLVNRNYFSVLQVEWDTMVNWCLSLDEKSLTFQNVMTHLRRMAPGVSLVNKELTRAWTLPRNRYRMFALAALIYTRRLAVENRNLEAIAHNGDYSAFTFIARAAVAPFSLLNALASSLVHSTIADNIVVYHDNFVETRVYAPINVSASPFDPVYKLTVGLEGELTGDFCDFCSQLEGKLGNQLVSCENCKSSGEREVAMTEGEIEVVRNELQNDDNDQGGLREVKKKAKEALPSAFSRVVKFGYILGGPGTGKSYIIRMLLDERSAVYVPFMKLKVDYSKEAMGGLDVNFATVHRGLNLPAVETLLIDEFTALDWRYMKMVIAKTGATQVYIVGDTEQTRVDDPSEGQYIGNHVDIATLPRHVLTRNFRNPLDAVFLANKYYGHKMQGMSTQEESISVKSIWDYKIPVGAANEMYFSHASAAERGKTVDSEKYTVRSFQGSTVDDGILFVTAHDSAVCSVHGMNLVALTRHRKSLTIYVDGSAFADSWLEQHGLAIGKAVETSDEFLPVYDAVTFAQKATPPAEPKEVVDFYKNAKEFLPLPSFRRELCWFSRSDMVVMLLGVPLFLFSGHFSGTLLGNVMSLTLLFTAYKMSFGRVVLRPLESLRYVWLSIMKTYMTSPLVLYFVLRTPKFLSQAIVLPHRPQPLVRLVCDLAFPPWFNAQVLGLMGWLTDGILGYVSLLLNLSSLPGLSGLQTLASVLAHFHDAIYLPDMVFIVLGRRLVVAVVCAWLVFHSRNGLPSFVVYVQSDQELILGVSPLVCFGLPNAKLAIQIMERDYLVPVGFVQSVHVAGTFTVNYVETAGKFFVKGFNKCFLFHPEVDLEKALGERYVTPKDSYQESFEGLPAQVFDDLATPLNVVGSSKIPDNFKSGKIDIESFVSPMTSKGAPKAQTRWLHRFTKGIGHSFVSSSMAQLVNVTGSRYLSKKSRPAKAFGPDAEKLAENMVNEFFKEHMSYVDGFDEDLFAEIEQEADRAAATKHYDAQLQGIDNPNFRRVMMHLKDIFKPSPKKVFDENKPGQGISAWSKDAQVTFGTCIRYFNAVMQRKLLPHVVFDNRMTQEQVMAMLKNAAEKTPFGSKNGVTDFTMFDAQQNEFTQCIEQKFLARLGASEEFISLYYSCRKNYDITAGPVQGTAGTEKTSGEPGTLLFNSIVNVVLMNYLLRGEGPVAMAMKGDDGYKRQSNLKLNLVRMAEYESYSKMTIKISYDDPAEFCGCVIGRNSMAPNLYRRLCSLQGKSFKSYKAFADYQTSLRDWLRTIINSDVNEVIALNALTFNPSNPEETVPAMQGVLDDLVSFSHIDEAAFLAATEIVRPLTYHRGSAHDEPMVASGCDAHELSREEIEIMALDKHGVALVELNKILAKEE